MEDGQILYLENKMTKYLQTELKWAHLPTEFKVLEQND